MKLLPFVLVTALGQSSLTGLVMAAEPAASDTPEPLPAGALARFGSFRARVPSHQHPRAACAPAHKLLATGGFDDTVFLFDLTTGRRLRSIRIDDQSAGPMALAPDGKSLVVECRADLCIFDVATGKETARLTGHGSRIDGLVFSTDGKWLASCGGREDIRVWEAATGKLHRLIKPGDKYVRFLAFGPDNRTLGALMETDKKDIVRCWDAVTGTMGPMLVPGMRAGTLAFSPDGKALAVAGESLRLLDRATGKELWNAGFVDKDNHQRRLCRVVFSPDGKQVATASGLTIFLFDARTGRPAKVLKARAKPGTTDATGVNFITLLAFAGDGRALYSWACGDRVRAWDLQTGQNSLASDGHQGTVLSAAFSPDGKRIISTAEDDHVRVWEAGTGKEINLASTGIHGSVLASDGYRAVTKGKDNEQPRLVDVMGKDRAELGVPPWVFSPDGKFLVGVNGDPGDQIDIRRTDTGKTIGALSCIKEGKRSFLPVGPSSFALDRPLVAILDTSGDVTICELGDAVKRVQAITPREGRRATRIALSADGTLLAGVVGGDTVAIWQTATGKEVRSFQTTMAGDLLCLAFSPDNRTLVSGGEHLGVRLWEFTSGQLRCQWPGHQGFVTAVGFSRDGRRIVSGSQDWTLLTWDVASPPGKLALKNAEDGWQALSSADAEIAYWAICQLVRHPGTMALLREQVADALKVGGPPIARLIRQLDSDSFEEREKASEELEKLGKEAEDAIRKALADNPSVEVKVRLDRLLENIKPGAVAPSRLRWTRTVEVLEKIGTAEAHQLLRQAARSSAGGFLPDAAREATTRLDRAQKAPK